MEGERGPSGYAIERAVSAWQQLQAIYANDPTLADDEDVISAALADAEIPHPEVLLERAIDACIWAERREVEADDLRREMVARRDRYRARSENMRRIIADLMAAIDTRRHRAKLGRALIVRTAPSIVIIDEQALPDEYCRIVREPNKTLIHEHIDQGVIIPGAVLSNAGETVQIRKG